jgi:hypothetical protein
LLSDAHHSILSPAIPLYLSLIFFLIDDRLIATKAVKPSCGWFGRLWRHCVYARSPFHKGADMKPPSVKRKDEKPSRVVTSQPDASSSKIGDTAPRRPAFEDLHARISVRAHELFLQRGCREGCALEDWLDAEREILDRQFAV